MPFLRSDEAPTQAEREKMPKHVFGDPSERKYPLDTDAHVRAAASYLEKEHGAGRLSDAKYHEILTRVNAAKKARGIGDENRGDAPKPKTPAHQDKAITPERRNEWRSHEKMALAHMASAQAHEAAMKEHDALAYGHHQQAHAAAIRGERNETAENFEAQHTAESAKHFEAAKTERAASYKEALAAGPEWDEAKHPRDENGKFDSLVEASDAPRFDTGTVFRLDLSSGSITERRRTPQGGLVAPANLTRTGIFEYRMPDGSRRRELRSPDEVFSPDSLATYPIAPVTVDHPGRVGPSNWKTHAVGTVGGGVRRNGDFVSGDLHIQHGDAMDRAESGELREISCGYTCDIDPTPGTYQGQPYDVSQRKIRMNHVALGPRGWGRMGPDTRMHLDAAAAVSGEVEGELPETPGAGRYLRADQSNRPRSGANKTMPTPDEQKAVQDKADADAQAAKLADDLAKAQKDVEQAREDAKTAKTQGEKLAAQAREDTAKIATLTAENELLKHQVERSRSDGKTAEQKRQAEIKQQADVEEIVALRADARLVFASVEDPEGKNWKADGKNADQIRREIIMHLEPSVKLDSVVDPSGIYDIAMAHARRAATARKEAEAIANGTRHDAAGGGGDEMGDDEETPDAESARKGMIKRKKDAWKMPKKDRRPGMMSAK